MSLNFEEWAKQYREEDPDADEEDVEEAWQEELEDRAQQQRRASQIRATTNKVVIDRRRSWREDNRKPNPAFKPHVAVPSSSGSTGPITHSQSKRRLGLMGLLKPCGSPYNSIKNRRFSDPNVLNTASAKQLLPPSKYSMTMKPTGQSSNVQRRGAAARHLAKRSWQHSAKKASYTEKSVHAGNSKHSNAPPRAPVSVAKPNWWTKIPSSSKSTSSSPSPTITVNGQDSNENKRPRKPFVSSSSSSSSRVGVRSSSVAMRETEGSMEQRQRIRKEVKFQMDQPSKVSSGKSPKGNAATHTTPVAKRSMARCIRKDGQQTYLEDQENRSSTQNFAFNSTCVTGKSDCRSAGSTDSGLTVASLMRSAFAFPSPQSSSSSTFPSRPPLSPRHRSSPMRPVLRGN